MFTSVTLTAKMYSLHCFQSPFFIALDAATTCSRMLSGGPILPKQQADLATGRERQLTMRKRAERT